MSIETLQEQKKRLEERLKQLKPCAEARARAYVKKEIKQVEYQIAFEERKKEKRNLRQQRKKSKPNRAHTRTLHHKRNELRLISKGKKDIIFLDEIQKESLKRKNRSQANDKRNELRGASLHMNYDSNFVEPTIHFLEEIDIEDLKDDKKRTREYGK